MDTTRIWILSPNSGRIFPTTDVLSLERISYFEVCLETLLWTLILILMTVIIALVNKAVIKAQIENWDAVKRREEAE